MPNARSVGKVMSVPEPTMVLIVPAAQPASRIATTSNGVTSCGGCCGRRLVHVRCHGRRRRRGGTRVRGVLGLRDRGLDGLVRAGQLVVTAGLETFAGAVVG